MFDPFWHFTTTTEIEWGNLLAHPSRSFEFSSLWATSTTALWLTLFQYLLQMCSFTHWNTHFQHRLNVHLGWQTAEKETLAQEDATSLLSLFAGMGRFALNQTMSVLREQMAQVDASIQPSQIATRAKFVPAPRLVEVPSARCVLFCDWFSISPDWQQLFFSKFWNKLLLQFQSLTTIPLLSPRNT